jgi:prepilin-type N-terminal cleavage/methylation domain-containing protein
MANVRAPRGFTLIELMVVVTIVGVLSSVALPTFQRSVLRTKVAERATIMLRLKHAIQDHYVRTGSAVPGGGTIDSGWNPSHPPTTLRRPMATNLANWNTFFSAPGGASSLPNDIEGGVYYSYRFIVTEEGGSSTITLLAEGDLDGDSVLSTKRLDFARTSGVYQLTAESPPLGQEDDAGPTATF